MSENRAAQPDSQNTEKIRDKRLANLRPFQPGQSGNPGGRPKSKLLSEAYRQVLQDMERDGNSTVAEGIAKAIARKAKRGFVGAAAEIADRTEGKPLQAIHMTGGIDEQTAKRLTELAEMLLTPEQIRTITLEASVEPAQAKPEPQPEPVGYIPPHDQKLLASIPLTPQGELEGKNG